MSRDAWEGEDVGFVILFVVLAISFGLLLQINGVLLIFSPETWARIPQYLRLAPRIRVGIAWSSSRSSVWMRRVLGVIYVAFGAVRALCIGLISSKPLKQGSGSAKTRNRHRADPISREVRLLASSPRCCGNFRLRELRCSVWSLWPAGLNPNRRRLGV